MKTYPYILVKSSLFIAIFLLASTSAFAEIEKFHGKAVNSDGDLVFFEEHTIRYVNDQIATMNTVYYDAHLNKIGELTSDFSHGPQMGSYDFKDLRASYRDGAKVTAEQILIYCKEEPEADTQKKVLQRESGQIVGQGFHHFIQANLDVLAKGKIISAKLVLPAQMDQFKVRILKKSLDRDRLQVRIEMDNWFLRLFAPHVEAEYDINTRQLLAYKGVSAISNSSGKTIPVTISYDYSRQSLLVRSQSVSAPTELAPN